MSDTLTKRAIFDLLRRGPLSAAEASLYPRVLPEMVRDGIARRNADGSVELVSATQYASAGSSAPPPPTALPTAPPAAPLTTISSRVLPEDIAFLEELEQARNISRADAIRFVFERARNMGSRFTGSAPRRRVQA